MPTKKAKPAKVSKAKSKVQVTMVLDKSGSMSNCRQTTVEGINEYFHGLRQDQDTEYFISLIQFDILNAGPELLVTHDDKPLSEVKAITIEDYEPRGSTPLYDAVGECLRRVKEGDFNQIVVVITDGYENASREFTKEMIRTLIKSKEEKGWTFVFLGADIDAMQEGTAMGAQSSNSVSYKKANTVPMFAAMAQSTIKRSAAYRSFDADQVVGTSFLSDEQKVAINQDHTDPNVVPHFVTGTTILPNTPYPGTTLFPQGGPSPAQPTFPGNSNTDAKRKWVLSQPGGDSSES